jgi:hypothetical protein
METLDQFPEKINTTPIEYISAREGNSKIWKSEGEGRLSSISSLGPKVWVVSGIFNLFERTSLLCLGEAKRHLVVMSSVNKCTA